MICERVENKKERKYLGNLFKIFMRYFDNQQKPFDF